MPPITLTTTVKQKIGSCRKNNSGAKNKEIV